MDWEARKEKRKRNKGSRKQNHANTTGKTHDTEETLHETNKFRERKSQAKKGKALPLRSYFVTAAVGIAVVPLPGDATDVTKSIKTK